MSEILISETHGRIVRLIMNRPERRNALNAQLCRELVDSIHHANHDSRVGCVVLTANGSAFCAGMDLQEVGHVDEENLAHLHDQLFTMGSRLSKPLVAAVNGAALAGGFGLLANCHIVVASNKATFGLTEVRVGLWPFLVQRAAVNAVGERRFTELALTGRIFGVEEAKEMALIQVIHEDPNAKVMEIAEQLAGASLPALRAGLNYIQEIRGEDWEMAGMLARNARDELTQGGDFLEGLRAFREKRSPNWPSLQLNKRDSGTETL